jgi:hypothetical protein
MRRVALSLLALLRAAAAVAGEGTVTILGAMGDSVAATVSGASSVQIVGSLVAVGVAVAVAGEGTVTIAGDVVAAPVASVIPFGYAGARRGPIFGEPLRRLYKRASLGERIAVLGGRGRRR